MKPSLFNVGADDVSNDQVPLIKPWKTITLDPDYAGAWIVAGDVNGDGQVEIVSARNVDQNDNHYTCSVVVHRLDGTVLWRWGKPEEGRNQLHHDVACQIYDWDGDGRNEVIVAANRAVVVLDGATGEEQRRFIIPEDSSDCLVFANLSGGKRATDVMIKTRYSQIWAFNRDGEQMWTVRDPGGYRTAHQPRTIDLDGNGKDSVMAGYAMLNPDGTIRWSLRDSGLPLGRGHLDCARVFRQGKTLEDFRIVITLCGDEGIAMLDGHGTVLWSIQGRHFESISLGRVRTDVPGKQIIVDVDHSPAGQAPLWVIGENGEWLGQIMTQYCRKHLAIDWDGSGVESIVIAQHRAMYDGWGRKIAAFDASFNEAGMNICAMGDMTGDEIPDLLLWNNPAREIFIFKNEKGLKIPGIPLGTRKNFTLY